MSKQRLLDIIIPSYNRPLRLFTLLKSGLELHMAGVYFVVIDDGSELDEYIPNVGLCSTQQVCEYFNNPAIIYRRNPENIGLARSWVNYYETYCDAKYTLSIVDKDFFVDKTPIMNAINQLEHDDSLCMVVIPLMQEDRANTHTLITFNYSKMTSQEFISQFVRDVTLQHCSSYGVKRVSSIRQAGVPDNLYLKDKGLDDGFGIDIDLVLRLASTGNVGFEREAHIKRTLMEGATERYPLTFAYTYYQYAKRVIAILKKKNMIGPDDARQYIKMWLLIVLSGLVVAYRSVHGSELEQGTKRISKHLKIPIHLYLLIEAIKHGIRPSQEMIDLYRCSLRLTLDSKYLAIKKSVIPGIDTK